MIKRQFHKDLSRVNNSSFLVYPPYYVYTSTIFLDILIFNRLIVRCTVVLLHRKERFLRNYEHLQQEKVYELKVRINIIEDY